MFSDAEAAALYDLLNPWDPDNWPADRFYEELVMAATSVLDVGCGTGAMLHLARERGHPGRLVGLDPDHAALARARRRADIEWVNGTAAEASWDAEFDLATMTGHAFQCLVTDDDVRTSLAAIHSSLRAGGRFVFETRHPQARAWEDWNPSNAVDVIGSDPAGAADVADPGDPAGSADPSNRDAPGNPADLAGPADAAHPTNLPGRPLRVWHEVESVTGELVTFTGTTAEPNGPVLRIDRATLRFLDVASLNTFLTDAGLNIQAQYGDWHHGPITTASREIITIARRD